MGPEDLTHPPLPDLLQQAIAWMGRQVDVYLHGACPATELG